MASETARQTSLIQEDPPADECRENVPPEVSVATKLKVQTENEMSSPVRLCEGNGPGSNISTLSTPTLSGGHGGKARSQLSGIQSAVTPVLKRLNINNKCSTPLKHGNSPHPSAPFYPMEVSSAHRESKGDFWRQMWAKEAPFSLIQEESLPEISSLELTYLQLTANDSVLPQGSTTTFSDETHQVQVSVGESGGSSEVSQLTVTTTSADLRTKSASAMAGILDTEITLLDDSYNNDLSPVGQISSLDIIRDIPACYLNDSNTLPEPSRQIESQPSSSNVFLNKDVSSTSTQSPKCATDGTISMSLEVTHDISVGSTLENGTFSSETSRQKMQTSHTSDEDKVVLQPANITHDISASSGNSSLKEIPSDVCLHSGPKEVNSLVETKNEENQTCCDTKSTNKMSQQSPEPAASANDTFTVPSSNMTASSDSSTSASCSGNKTLDLPTVNNPTAESETKNQAEPVAKTSFVVNQSSFSEKKNFEKSFLQKSSGGSTLEAAAVSFENPTFDCEAPSQRNGTITLSEISSTDDHHTLDKSSSPKVCNLTTSLNHNDSEGTPKELPRHEATPPPGMEEKPGDTLEVIPSDVCLHSGPKEVNSLVETKNEANQTCCDTKSTNKMSQQSPEPAASANDTFTVPSSNMTASSDSSTSASCSGNKTLDLPTVNNPTAESETKNQAEPVAKTSFVVNQSSFSEKKNFEKSSLQKSSGGSTLEAAAVSFENPTFDCEAPSLRNGTITLLEISSTDGHHTLDKSSSPKVCNLTTSLNHNDSEGNPKELPRHEATPPPGMEEKPGGALEVTPALEGVSGDNRGDTKHLSQSGLPVRDGSSDTSNNQGEDAVSNKTPEFNLDETLDLRADLLVTSTPMTNCKSFNVGSIGGAAHKKLYEAGPSKPADAAVSDIPPNIVGDRKTFMKQPAVGTLRPPSRVAPQSSVSRRGSTIPGRLEKMSAGLPLKRSRIQEAAGKPSAAMEEPRGNAGTSGSHNLRSLTAASRKLLSDLQKPPSSTIPRLTTGLRLPTARTHTLASSGPAVPNPVVKQPLGKRHPFPKGEALPVSKKKKTDASAPSINAEAPASPGDATSKVKTLKRPVVGQTSAPTKVQRNDAEMSTAGTSETSTSCDRPSRFRALKPPGANQRAPLATSQSHGCAKCMVLQEELKLKSEEVQRLNEELLKYRKPDDC